VSGRDLRYVDRGVSSAELAGFMEELTSAAAVLAVTGR
jgi:hypothetical protein